MVTKPNSSFRRKKKENHVMRCLINRNDIRIFAKPESGCVAFFHVTTVTLYFPWEKRPIFVLFL